MQLPSIPDRFKDAWSFAAALDNVESWTALGEMAVQHLEIDFGTTESINLNVAVCMISIHCFLAIHAYQQVKNVSMVYSLRQIRVCN